MNTSLASQCFSALASSLGWRFTIAFSAIALVAPAFAGTSDKMVAPEPIVEPCNWNGFYAGGSLGIAMGDYDFEGYRARVFPEGTFVEGGAAQGVLTVTERDFSEIFDRFIFHVPRHNDDAQVGLMGGGQIGYNLVWNRWLFGVEGDIHATDIDAESKFRQRIFATETFTDLGEDFQAEADVEYKAVRRATTDMMASARFRLGYTFGCFLLYGTGGVAFADIDISGRDRSRIIYTGTEFDESGGIQDVDTFGPFSNSFNGSAGDDFEVGWTAGGGGEVMINKWLSMGVEYRHSDFGTFDYDPRNTGGLSFRSGADSDIDFSVDQVVLKVNILFSGLFGR